MKAFEVAGKMYLRVTPVKNLFHSTMVHEVVNRGDVFVIRVEDMALTVMDRNLVPAAKESYLNVCLMPVAPEPEPPKQKTKRVPTVTVAKMKRDIKEFLDAAQKKLDGM